MLKVNLGCGPIFIDSSEWMNLDFTPATNAVRQANLLKRLPLPDGTASLVYSSHFLEHVPRTLVPGLLRECLRVLQPGGVLRLVVPDLEDMAREYLAMREMGEHDKADFVVLELIDQCVRRKSGGELGQLYRQMAAQSKVINAPMIDYIYARSGEDLCTFTHAEAEGTQPPRFMASLYSYVKNAWIRLCLFGLPAAFREQNVSIAAVGELHHWLWDFHQIKTLLEVAGFVDVQRSSANSSAVADFPFQPLDINVSGDPRKGLESMFVEAIKPK
jgi:SAM-dependent methyltransferase